ncbi:hypothetical protein CH252_03920 [Rhodococcus sp. 06-1477-1B]|nr:hypothetical protein CH252_03920 [Rhodococcus sp. 06-1477-1B]
MARAPVVPVATASRVRSDAILRLVDNQSVVADIDPRTVTEAPTPVPRVTATVLLVVTGAVRSGVMGIVLFVVMGTVRSGRMGTVLFGVMGIVRSVRMGIVRSGVMVIVLFVVMRIVLFVVMGTVRSGRMGTVLFVVMVTVRSVVRETVRSGRMGTALFGAMVTRAASRAPTVVRAVTDVRARERLVASTAKTHGLRVRRRIDVSVDPSSPKTSRRSTSRARHATN